MYLAKLLIEGYRGIDRMALEFNPAINVIIGENGQHKTTIIDAIRLFYSLGDARRDIFVNDEDFHADLRTGVPCERITIRYEFRGLSEKEKGALYEYMVITDDDQYAAITITFEMRPDKHPKWNYYTGAHRGQRADANTFEIFQHYYLGALRDSTKDLLSTRSNALGRVISRAVLRNESASNYTELIKATNENLLAQDEVKDTKESINENLESIHSMTPPIDLHIEQSRADYIVNAIKPFLPFGREAEAGAGLRLSQNSLGHNNLVYIATVLADMKDRTEADRLIHFALLIEEPEAHLHPQLQLNLYDFLKRQSRKNCQLFITTHSPTLTSRVDLDSLLAVGDQQVKCIGKCFIEREQENIRDAHELLTKDRYKTKKKMLERYIDVTRSQIFYAKSVLMVEGISEELLFAAFARLQGFRLEEHDIELIQTGTSFAPFVLLFNSKNDSKRLNKRVAIVTDDDRFTESKASKYSFRNIASQHSQALTELHEGIESGSPCSRIANLQELQNNQSNIKISVAYKTLEYEIALANIPRSKEDFESGLNLLISYLCETRAQHFGSISSYLKTISEPIEEVDKRKLALLLWKSMPQKSLFAQGFSHYITEQAGAPQSDFQIPSYILAAFSHLGV